MFKEMSATVWNTGTSTSASKTYTGLDPAKAYEFKVANVCNGVQGVFSIVNSFILNNAPVSVPTLSTNTIEIFPNPAHDLLNVAMNNTAKEEISIRLIDLGGRTVYGKKIIGNKEALDIHSIQQGIYTLQINGANGFVYRTKFVKN